MRAKYLSGGALLPVISLCALLSSISLVDSQAFLWDRIPETGPPGFPQDCVKQWGPCLSTGEPPSILGSYYREQIVVVPAKNGGDCTLENQRYCEETCTLRPPCGRIDCTKRWSDCFGTGPNSYRIEIEVEPARNGGTCELTYEFGCSEPSQTPVDCTKRWGRCIGFGPSSFRDEVVVTPARFGGACDLRREFGCNPFPPPPPTTKPTTPPPVNCKKRWGKCIGNGPDSVRKEIIVTPAKHGGKCKLNEEKGCRFDPVDCVKKWGKCSGVGEDSFREEEVVTKAMYGGKCKLRTEKECNTPPQDCVKRWGICIGKGPGSYRDEVVVTKEKYGGKCNIQREMGCNKAVDCVKTWGQCIGKGVTSYRKEMEKTPARFGGKPCSNFKTEMGCDKSQQSPPKEKDEDDTNGKTLATLLIANFMVEGVEGGAVESRTLIGARSFIGPPAQLGPALDDVGKNCSELKNGDKVIAIGCDDADDIDPAVKKEVSNLPIRKGVKRSNAESARRRRSTDPENPKPETPRDVLFFLDSSGSVGPYHFEILKEVCKAIIDVLCGRISLGKWQTRISMATFNARQQLSFPFTTTSSNDAVKKKIDAVGFDYVYSYQSCIKDALKFVLTDIYLEKNGARDPSFAEGDMFFLTDGCANCDFRGDNKELQRLAYRLKLNKINVYAIGIGIDKNCRDILKVLARGGRCFHFFYLDNWDHDVKDFLYRLKNPPQDRCLDRWEYPGINCLEKRQG